MLNGIFGSTTIPLLATVADFAQVRHTVLAGNLANLDTPGYRAMDLPVAEFHKHLRKAIEERSTSFVLSLGDRPTLLTARAPEWARESRPLVRHDGNDVSVEEQVSEMVKNQMLHNTALTILGSQFRLLLTAINERV